MDAIVEQKSNTGTGLNCLLKDRVTFMSRLRKHQCDDVSSHALDEPARQTE